MKERSVFGWVLLTRKNSLARGLVEILLENANELGIANARRLELRMVVVRFQR